MNAETPQTAAPTSYDDTFTWNKVTQVIKPSVVLENPSSRYSDYDFIATLGLAQRLNIHFLSMSWQASLGPLSIGGQADIWQALVNIQSSFVFKSFEIGKGNTINFATLIKEIIVLSHPMVMKHPNIVRLEGIGWDIDQETEHVSPVLVFEKSQYGDLHRFIVSDHDGNLPVKTRLKLCVDVAVALRDMHCNGIIHGDLKPKNVLIFKDEQGVFVARVMDFGCSTGYCNENDLVMIRDKSIPWNDPEIHHRLGAVSVLRAKRMDIYSLGVLCLWVIFEGHEFNLADFFTSTQTSERKMTIMDLLYRRINDKTFLCLSLELLEKDDRLDIDMKTRLGKIFQSTLTEDPTKRCSNLDDLLKLMSPDRNFQPINMVGLEDIPEYESFKIETSFYEFYPADFRLRKFIANELRSIVSAGPSSNSQQRIKSRNATLQLALCHRLGFGVTRDLDISNGYLETHEIPASELHQSIDQIRIVHPLMRLQPGLYGKLDTRGFIARLSLFQLSSHQNKLDTVLQESVEEIEAVRQEFGSEHRLVFILKSQLARMLKEVGRLKDAELLDNEVIEQSRAALGSNNQFMMDSVSNLASVYHRKGHFEQSISLRKQFLRYIQQTLDQDHPQILTTIANLASTLRQLGRPEDAEDLERKIVERRKLSLGKDHVETLASMANLAATLSMRGKWIEAEQLELEVIARGTKAVGQDHPLVLAWKSNLGTTYMDLGRYQEALALKVAVFDAQVKILGGEHPDTLTCMDGIASLFGLLGSWKDAEKLHILVMNQRQKVLGPDHPSTLISISHVASTYQTQGRLEDAEALELLVIQRSTKVLGEDHHDVLTSKGNLAVIYRRQNRFKEASDLLNEVLEATVRRYGPEHPGALSTINTLGTTLYSQGRYAEAEKHFLNASELRERLEGPNNSSTLNAKGNLAMAYWKQGKLKEAEDVQAQVLERWKDTLGDDHESTLNAMHNLASFLESKGQIDQAVQLMSQCVEKRKVRLGTDHEMTKESAETLQEWQTKHYSS